MLEREVVDWKLHGAGGYCACGGIETGRILGGGAVAAVLGPGVGSVRRKFVAGLCLFGVGTVVEIEAVAGAVDSPCP